MRTPKATRAIHSYFVNADYEDSMPTYAVLKACFVDGYPTMMSERTLYRVLRRLQDSGVLRRLASGDGVTFYGLAALVDRLPQAAFDALRDSSFRQPSRFMARFMRTPAPRAGWWYASGPPRRAGKGQLSRPTP